MKTAFMLEKKSLKFIPLNWRMKGKASDNIVQG